MTKPKSNRNIWAPWQRQVDKPTSIEVRFENGRWIIIPLGIFISLNFYILVRYGISLSLTGAHPLNLLPGLTSLLIVLFGSLYCLRLWKSPPPPHFAKVTAYTLLILFLFLIYMVISALFECDTLSQIGVSCTDQVLLYSPIMFSMSLFGYILKVLLIIGIISLLVQKKKSKADKSRKKRS